MTYARGTEVSVEKSKMEIERTLLRYGASEFASAWRDGSAMIGFKMEKRMIRFILPLPSREAFRFTPGRRNKRNDADTAVAWEQGCREKWRALGLAIKAKMEAVECVLASFEEEFLAYTLLPNGMTVADWVREPMDKALSSGVMPALMLPMLPAPR